MRLPYILASYYTTWAFLLYFLIRNKSSFLKNSLLFFGIPTLLSQLIYGFTATLAGGIIPGHYLGLIFAAIVFIEFVNARSNAIYRQRIVVLCLLAMMLSLVGGYSLRAYFTAPMWESRSTLRFVKQGLLAGMLVDDEHIQYVEKLNAITKEYSSGATSVFFGAPFKVGYLLTSLRPIVGNPWGPTITFLTEKPRILKPQYKPNLVPFDSTGCTNTWHTSLDQFERIGYPDLIIVTPFEASASDAQSLLHEKYNRVFEDEATVVFRKKS